MTVELRRRSAFLARLPSDSEDLLARLVGFDTTSSKSNLALIDFVEGQLKGHGIASTPHPLP